MGLTHKKRVEIAKRLEKEFGPDSSIILHTFDDGWTIRRCRNYRDLNREGMLMSNCWRNAFWTEANLRTYPYGAGMREHFKIPQDRKPGRVLKVEDVKTLTPGHLRRLIRPKFYSLRDPDNIPHCSFFCARKEFTHVLGPHNGPLKRELCGYLGEFQIILGKFERGYTHYVSRERRRELRANV